MGSISIWGMSHFHFLDFLTRQRAMLNSKTQYSNLTLDSLCLICYKKKVVKKDKSFISPSENRTHNRHVYSHTLVPLRHDWPPFYCYTYKFNYLLLYICHTNTGRVLHNFLLYVRSCTNMLKFSYFIMRLPTCDTNVYTTYLINIT